MDQRPPPAPPGLQYRKYQIDAILAARKYKNLLIADPMGSGKSIEAIGVINDNPDIRKVLIVCPASLKINWQRELVKWLVRRHTTIGIATSKRWTLADIVIVNYESLKPLHRNIHNTEWDLLITDECFPAGTKVDTPNGSKPIEDIRVGDTVISAAGEDTVLGTSVSTAPSLVEIETEDGDIIRCTPGHKIMTNAGWVESRSIKAGAMLMRTSAAEEIVYANRKDLRMVWRDLYREECQGLQEEEILRKILLSEMEDEPARDTSKGTQQESSRQEERSFPAFKRVVRVEVQEQDYSKRSSYGRGEVEVYNLHVRKHPSYSVNGILVHNCHFLKNPYSRRSMEIMGSKHKDPMKRKPKLEVKRALFMTGTPIVNRPFEIFPLINYLRPDVFPSKDDFINKFCGGTPKGQKKSDIGEDNLKALQKELRETVMIRRKKEDIMGELPPKIRQIIVFPQEKARGVVNNERKNYAQIQKGLSIIRMKAELAKASDDDELYNQAVRELQQAEFITIQEIAKIRMHTALAKVQLVVDHVKELLLHVPKVVVFGHHISVLENIALEFGESVVVLHGKHSPEERQARLDRFQNDPTVRVMVAGMKATGVGLNITSANVVCFAELDWSPSTVNQCEDRLHRIGQRYSVLVQHLVLDGSIDSMIASRIVEKQETISTILDDVEETKEALYALSRATPFVPDDRQQIIETADRLSAQDIGQIHAALDQLTSRGPKKSMSALDFNIMRLLAGQEYLEPMQAALALAMLQKLSSSG